MKKFHYHLMESSKEFCNISNNIHCGKVITDEYAGELICSKCGVVLEEKTLSYRQEPTKNDSNEISPMMAINTKYICSSTTIGNYAKSFGIKDHTGKTIPNATKESLNRLYNSGNIQRTSYQKSQSIVSGMVKLDGLVHKLGLSENASQEAVRLYKKAHAAKIVSDRSVIGVMSACLYYSCKKLDIPRDMVEICDAANIKKSVLFSCYRAIVDSMELYSEKNYDDKNNNRNGRYVKDDYNTIAKQRHIRCIPKIISKLGLPQRICRQAASLILLQDDYFLSGKNPNAVAATAIYITCNHDKKYHFITQREMSEASGITAVSISNLSKKIIR